MKYSLLLLFEDSEQDKRVRGPIARERNEKFLGHTPENFTRGFGSIQVHSQSISGLISNHRITEYSTGHFSEDKLKGFSYYSEDSYKILERLGIHPKWFGLHTHTQKLKLLFETPHPGKFQYIQVFKKEKGISGKYKGSWSYVNSAKANSLLKKHKNEEWLLYQELGKITSNEQYKISMLKIEPDKYDDGSSNQLTNTIPTDSIEAKISDLVTI